MKNKKLIAGNWKMNNTPDESKLLIESIIKELSKEFINKVDILFFPPYTSLDIVSKSLNSSGMYWGAQNVHYKDNGAFTGEISPTMLKSFGCSYVIIGHSERRSIFKENDDDINQKIENTMKNNIIPVFCIGEKYSERSDNKHFKVIEKQIVNGLQNINGINKNNFVIAYEPVWAIGTGVTATPEQANEMHKYIRTVVAKLFNENLSREIRILYGGSMNDSNSKTLLEMPDIDGGLIGGASLKAESFIKIIKSAIL